MLSSIAETAIPTRISLGPATPWREDNPYTNRAVPRPKMTARRETAIPSNPRMTMAKTAAALAPELMPMISGLASGLRSITWNAAPAIPKLAPASMARMARGRRSCPTVNEAPATFSPRITLSTSPGGTIDLPIIRVQAKAMTANASRTTFRRSRLCLCRLRRAAFCPAV